MLFIMNGDQLSRIDKKVTAEVGVDRHNYQLVTSHVGDVYEDCGCGAGGSCASSCVSGCAERGSCCSYGPN